MSERIWFKKEVSCADLELNSICEFKVDHALNEMQKEFDGLVCDVELKPGRSFESDKFVLSCSGRLNAKYEELMRPAVIFSEFANKMLMTAITSIADGALKLIGITNKGATSGHL